MVLKKAAAALVFSLLIFFFVSPGYAEHKLLPTDVLDAKQVEGIASLTYERQKQDFSFQYGTAGSVYYESFYSSYSLGVGLGYGFEVKASIPYIFSNHRKVEYNSGAASFWDGNGGFEDFSLTGKYLVLDEKKYPFALAAGLGVKFNTAGTTGPISSGDSTDFKPFLAISKKVGESVIPYAVYEINIRSNDNYQNRHGFFVGSEFKLNQTVSLVPEAAIKFYNDSKNYTSFEEYQLQLSSYIQAFRNFYVIPRIGIGTATDYRYKFSTQKNDPQYTFATGLTFYYLW